MCAHVVVGTLQVWLVVYALVCVYWLTSLLVVVARVRSDAFAALTDYGGRIVARRTNASPSTPRRGSHADSDGAAHSQTTTTSSMTRLLLASLQQRTPLCRRCVRRQVAFCAFYVCGLATTCTLLWRVPSHEHKSLLLLLRDVRVAPLRRGEALPLLAFALHCAVRLVECACVQRFRATDDAVTPFALLAGCSFYVAAAVSSDTTLLRVMRAHMLDRSQQQQQQSTSSSSSALLALSSDSSHVVRLPPLAATLAALSSLLSPPVLDVLLCGLFALHVALQATQALHHLVLARMRAPGARGVTSSEAVLRVVHDGLSRHLATAARVATHDDGGDARWLRDGPRPRHRRASTTTVTTTAATTKDSDDTRRCDAGDVDARVWRYHFPTTLLFRYVLEPHYLCEVLLYAVQATQMLLLVCFGVCVAPAAVRVYTPRVSRAHSGSVYTATRSAHNASASSPVLPFYYMDDRQHNSSSVVVYRATATLLCCVTLQLVAAAGVTAFTAVNLACTARQHRAFWRYVADEREYAATVLLPSLSPPPSHDNDDDDSSSSSGARRRREVRQLLLHRELLPPHNLVPGLW